MRVIQEIQALGIEIRVDGNGLLLTGNIRTLILDQIAWLKAHKPEILAELQAANQIATVRL